MELLLKFNNSSNGTLRWKDNVTGRNKIMRFTEKSMVEVCSQITLEIMDYVYGLSNMQRLEDVKGRYKIVYNWKDLGVVCYKGFKTKKALNTWLDIHQDWIDWEPL